MAFPAQAASTWSTPVQLNAGPVAVNAAGTEVAIVSAGAGAPTQARPSTNGLTWSTPVIDGSGNAIVAYAGAAGAIRTASLPAGGNWTAVKTLDTTIGSSGAALAVNSAGLVVITRIEPARTVIADSGTVLGGLAAPATVDNGSEVGDAPAAIRPDIYPGHT